MQSGQFTSTVKASLAIVGIEGAVTGGPSYHDADATSAWSGAAGNKLYLQSGQFSTTMRTSLDINDVDANIQGITHDDYTERTAKTGGEPPAADLFNLPMTGAGR